MSRREPRPRHCRIHGDYYGQYCSDCHEEKETLEYRHREEHKEKMAILRERNNSCKMCGRFFDDNTRRFPPIGMIWTGHMGQFQHSGICPKCYYKRCHEEVMASDDQCRYILRRTKTSFEAARIASELHDSHPNVAAEAKALQEKLETEESRQRAEEEIQRAEARTKAEANARQEKVVNITLRVISSIAIAMITYYIASGIFSCLGDIKNRTFNPMDAIQTPTPTSTTPTQPQESTRIKLIQKTDNTDTAEEDRDKINEVDEEQPLSQEELENLKKATDALLAAKTSLDDPPTPDTKSEEPNKTDDALKDANNAPDDTNTEQETDQEDPN